MRERILVFVSGLFCAGILLGCAAEDERADRTAVPRDEQAAAVVDWPCEKEGYPCTWEEVDARVIERLRSLGYEALDRFEPGGAEDLVAWLTAQPDMAVAEVVDPSVVRFRLDGARSLYVQGPLPEGPVSGPGRPDDTSERARPEVLLASAGHGISTLLRRAASRIDRPHTDGALPGVTGRDRNDDDRINQRDERRALILEPMDWEFCYESFSSRIYLDPKDKLEPKEIESRCRNRIGWESEGERVAEILEQIPAYAGNVTVLHNEEVDFEALSEWETYDVIHIVAHGSTNSLTIGIDVSWPGRGKLRGDAARRRGVNITVYRAGDDGPKKAVWSVNNRFFRQLYGEGLDRTLIYASSCSTLGHPDRPTPPLADQLLGDESMFVGWGLKIGTFRAEDVATGFYTFLAEGWSGEEAVKGIPTELGGKYGDPVYARDIATDTPDLMNCSKVDISVERIAEVEGMTPEEVVAQGGVEGWCRRANEEMRETYAEAQRRTGAIFGTRGSDMRIREVVKLFHPPSSLLGPGSDGERLVLLEDGDDLGRLIVGALDDGEDDLLRVTVAIEALKEDEPASTFVHLELDGEPIGEPWSFERARLVDYGPHGPTWAYRLDLDGPRVVEVGKELEAGREYELEAVVDLPEGGETRYAAKLSSEVCRSNTNGDLEGSLSGAISRTLERGDRQHSAKLFFEESGGPTELTLETVQLNDFNVTVSVVLDRLPEAGSRFLVEDPAVQADDIRGNLIVNGAGVGGRRDRVYGWQTGKAAVTIHQVNWDDTVPDRTRRRGWACGEIEADLVGWTEPPPGSFTPLKVPHNFKAEFWAEIRRTGPVSGTLRPDPEAAAERAEDMLEQYLGQ